MDITPGDVPSNSISHYDFSADEIEVANTLTLLNFLIPYYEFRNWGFLPPLWGSKRLRSACSPDHQRTESVVATDCPVISCGGNLWNISPDPPLLLKASPTSGDGAQGSPGIVVDPPREKEVTNKHGCNADDSAGIEPSKNNPQKPNGGAHASPGSPLRASSPKLLFDLNLTPPEFSGIQSPLPNEDGTPRLPPSDGAVADDGSNKAEATGQKSFRDMQGEMPQGCCIGHQGSEPRFRRVQ